MKERLAATCTAVQVSHISPFHCKITAVCLSVDGFVKGIHKYMPKIGILVGFFRVYFFFNTYFNILCLFSRPGVTFAFDWALKYN